MIIAHNIAAINTYRQYWINNTKKSKTLEKLSSGYRINRAGDDAAGLAISEAMRRNIRAMEQGLANARDGIGLVETAEGAMQEISTMLRRMHQLAVESANGTYTDEEREILQEEVDQLKEEINRISDNTEFNGVFLFKKEFTKAPEVVMSGSAAIQPGTNLPDWVGQSRSFKVGKMVEKIPLEDPKFTGTTGIRERQGGTLDFSKLNSGNVSQLIGKGFHSTCFTCDNHYSIMFVNGTDCKTEISGKHYVTKIGIDGVTNGEELVTRILDKTHKNASNNTTSSNAIIGEMGGQQYPHYTRLQRDPNNRDILVMYDWRPPRLSSDTSGSTLSQPTIDHPDRGKAGYGVAVDPKQIILPPPPPPSTGDLAIQLGGSADILWIDLPRASTAFLEIEDVSVETQDDASEAIESLEGAIRLLSEERGRMGAYENRLEHAMRSIEVTHENLTAAESYIRDADMALLITDLAKEGVLEQATQAMLAQSNTTAQGILSILNP